MERLGTTGHKTRRITVIKSERSFYTTLKWNRSIKVLYKLKGLSVSFMTDRSLKNFLWKILKLQGVHKILKNFIKNYFQKNFIAMIFLMQITAKFRKKTFCNYKMNANLHVANKKNSPQFNNLLHQITTQYILAHLCLYEKLSKNMLIWTLSLCPWTFSHRKKFYQDEPCCSVLAEAIAIS